jgi:hypothetical protein
MNVIARKLKGVFEILAYLPKGEMANFFYHVSRHLPDWLFKFNQGMILVSPSPRLPTRENPRFVSPGRTRALCLEKRSRAI